MSSSFSPIFFIFIQTHNPTKKKFTCVFKERKKKGAVIISTAQDEWLCV
jgi:hypothetical protein